MSTDKQLTQAYKRLSLWARRVRELQEQTKPKPKPEVRTAAGKGEAHGR